MKYRYIVQLINNNECGGKNLNYPKFSMLFEMKNIVKTAKTSFFLFSSIRAMQGNLDFLHLSWPRHFRLLEFDCVILFLQLLSLLVTFQLSSFQLEKRNVK